MAFPIDSSNDNPVASAIPAQSAAGTQGFFTNGNPVLSQPATIVTADFLNMLQQEIINVVTAASITPNKTNNTQLLQALRTLTYTKLTANTSFYVAVSGSDATGDGSVGNPWATLTHAWTYICSALNANGFSITINMGNGNYGGQALSGAPTGNPSAVSIIGNVSAPGNVAIVGFNVPGLSAYFCNSVGIGGMTISSTGTAGPYTNGGIALVVSLGAIYLNSPVVFAASTYAHIVAGSGGSFATGGVNYSIIGGALQHWIAENNGIITTVNSTITITGVPNFASAFCVAVYNAQVAPYSTTFIGTASGPRYAAGTCGTIDTNGGGASYLPGNSVGSTNTGGQYV